MKRSEIRLSNCQIKSIEIARQLAVGLHIVETVAGIKETNIVLTADCFICPDITDEEIDSLNKTAMERALRDIIRQLRN